jgi:hypothetical protein
MAIAFSDTSNKDGLIEICERLCHLGDTGISGDAVLLKQFTSAINDAYDEVLPYVFASEQRFQFDDNNNTTLPIATTNLVSGQRDYGFTTDSAGRSVLSIDKIAIKQDATTSDYVIIGQTDASDRGSRRIVEDNSTNTGIPTRYDLLGGSILLDPEPNYSATAGIKIWYSRTPDYFLSSDTTQTPGIPDMFHQLLAYIASWEWVVVNEPNETSIITRLENRIAERKRELVQFMNTRSKSQQVLRARLINPA